MIISCGKCGTAWADERYGVCPTCGNAKFKMTDMEATRDKQEQFEQRCWALFVSLSAHPDCESYDVSLLDAIECVYKFERKMAEMKERHEEKP